MVAKKSAKKSSARPRSFTSDKKQKQRKQKKSSKIKVLIVERKLSDDFMKSKEGEYFGKEAYDTIVDCNCDVYYYEDNKKKTLLKFRKSVIPLNLCKIGIECLKEAAKKKHDNRGAAAGVLDTKKLPSYANNMNQLIGQGKFRAAAYRSRTGKIVKNSLGNISQSNIIGYFDKRDRNFKNSPPCRTTAFTSQQFDKWSKVIPLIENIDLQFKKLIPKNHDIQYKEAQKTKFVIGDTAFSTVTINYNWRTALHKDAGDLKQGFGNLVVLEEGKYEGGSTGFPQFKVGVDCRHGDFLAMDVHEWHCNTKIKPISKDFTRLSLVAYLREKMVRCKGMKPYSALELASNETDNRKQGKQKKSGKKAKKSGKKPRTLARKPTEIWKKSI